MTLRRKEMYLKKTIIKIDKSKVGCNVEIVELTDTQTKCCTQVIGQKKCTTFRWSLIGPWSWYTSWQYHCNSTHSKWLSNVLFVNASAFINRSMMRNYVKGVHKNNAVVNVKKIYILEKYNLLSQNY